MKRGKRRIIFSVSQRLLTKKLPQLCIVVQGLCGWYMRVCVRLLRTVQRVKIPSLATVQKLLVILLKWSESKESSDITVPTHPSAETHWIRPAHAAPFPLQSMGCSSIYCHEVLCCHLSDISASTCSQLILHVLHYLSGGYERSKGDLFTRACSEGELKQVGLDYILRRNSSLGGGV